MRKSKLTLAVVGALFAMSAEAGTYVLQANKWGAAQEAAVAAAGGRVVYANSRAGIALVDSDNAGFAAAMKASQAVTHVDADVMLEFDVPQDRGTIEFSIVNPGAETFWGLQWAPRAVQAPQAHATQITGKDVRVAVIDGGIFAAHPDLTGRVDLARSYNFTVPSQTANPGTCNATSGNWNCDTGSFWHGTHVAGIIAARGNNAGVLGIAPEADIVALKALHNGSGSFSWVINAILYAATPIDEGGAGAHIINMSLGAETPRKQNGGLVAALNRAVNYANARGALVVVAAGNSAFDMDKPPASVGEGEDEFILGPSTIVAPAESGNAIAVSATGPVGFALGATNFSRPASYSNYGNFIWLAGPGGDAALPGEDLCTVPLTVPGSVTVECWVFDMVLSTSRTGWTWAAGTSMAAPAVSAVAALIKQKYPNATPAQLKTKLAQSAVDEGKKGQDNFYGHGFVNALRAVTQ